MLPRAPLAARDPSPVRARGSDGDALSHKGPTRGEGAASRSGAEGLVGTKLVQNLRAKFEFSCNLKLICPVQSRRQKYSSFFFSEFMIVSLHPARLRGASRTSRNVGAGCDGRFSSQRASSMRTNEGSRTAKSRGPDTPTLVSRWRRCIRISPATVARKPGAPRRSRISRKPVAQGGPDVRLNLWFLPPAFFLQAGHGCQPMPGLPCALFFRRGDERQTHLGRLASRAHKRLPGRMSPSAGPPSENRFLRGRHE